MWRTRSGGSLRGAVVAELVIRPAVAGHDRADSGANPEKYLAT